jgi:TPR repeat protein
MTEQLDEYLARQAVEARDYEKAIRLLRPLAERNSRYALLTLGWMHAMGVAGAGAPDFDAARSLYEHAASLGSTQAYLYLGRLVLLERRQETEARAAFERGAQLGDEECKTELERLDNRADEELARQAVDGREYEKAVRLLRPLAERNSRYAILTLGWMHEKGFMGTGTPDKKAARSLYEQAAAMGSATAYRYLGGLLLRAGDDAKGRAAFEAGAELGDVSSMAWLGRMMVEGRGGPVEFDSGVAWLRNAVAQGHLFAERTLLAIKEQNAHSILEKLSVKMSIVRLALRTLRFNPKSDLLR